MDVVSAVHSDQLRSTSGAGTRLETRLGLEVAETVRHVCQYGLGHHVRYLHLEDQRRQVSTHIAYGLCVAGAPTGRSSARKPGPKYRGHKCGHCGRLYYLRARNMVLAFAKTNLGKDCTAHVADRSHGYRYRG